MAFLCPEQGIGAPQIMLIRNCPPVRFLGKSGDNDRRENFKNNLGEFPQERLPVEESCRISDLA
jgi:hypothetical protein